MHALEQLTPTAAQRRRLLVQVYGLPAPQGSKRLVGTGAGRHMIEASKKVAPWRQDVVHATVRALEAAPWWDREALHLVLHASFTLPRPRSHYRAGKETAHLLRDGAPTYPATRPDLDKLLRSTGDALTTAGAYADDSRVVRIYASKHYPSARPTHPGQLDRPGAHLVLVTPR